MLKRISIAAILIAVLAAIPSALSAGTITYRYQEGTCENGNTWFSAAEYNDGVMVWIEGLDCNGHRYMRGQCRIRQVPNNPIEGMTPTHTGVGTGVGTGSAWSAVITRDSQGLPIWAAGIASDGTYYVVDGLTDGQ